MFPNTERLGKDQIYGPPLHIKPRVYNQMLELLEVQSNNRLTSEYNQEIKSYFAEQESGSSVNVAMIDLQPEIQWFMRPFLLDFLIELHASFRLQPQTLFLCLNIVDRYCSRRIVFKRHYQLVGCTALWIAAKYEDKKSRVPTLKELAMMCRNAYDEDMFIQMERHILATLEWSLGHPSLEDCLQLAISSCKLSSHATPIKYNNQSTGLSLVSAVTAIGRFLCEVSLYNKYFLSTPTSLISITANLLACSMLQLPHAALLLDDLTTELQDSGTCHETGKTAFDEDGENKVPVVRGPFISGLDMFTLNTIRKICLCLILQLSKSTEVLTKKYENLGVIQVVQNFTTRYSSIIKIISKNECNIEEEPENVIAESYMGQLSDILLQLPRSKETKNEEVHVPLTPPSASSQFSIFSHDCQLGTPMNNRSRYNSGYESVTDSPSQELNNIWSSPIPSKMHA